MTKADILRTLGPLPRATREALRAEFEALWAKLAKRDATALELVQAQNRLITENQTLRAELAVLNQTMQRTS